MGVNGTFIRLKNTKLRNAAVFLAFRSSKYRS